jgi:ABC-2 type transport system ATP-binding protein
MSEEPAVVASGLVKRFGSTTALNGLDLTVPRGTVYGLLGPNGAGKTTAVRVLSTLIKPDGGSAVVLGHDVVADANAVRNTIGLTGQYAALDEYLTGRANLIMIGQLSRLTARAAKRRADELLERFELTKAAGRAVKTYSGGMRRRLDLAASLIGYPEVLFLDEPTTGLDPSARALMWDIVRQLVADGTTLLLTTQYLEEADQLADNIVVMDKGRIIAQGTPLQLKQQAGSASLVVTVSHADDVPVAAALLRKTGAEVFVDSGARQLIAAADGLADMTRVASWLRDSEIEVDDIGLSRPSLDDVFLSLTGRRAEPGADAAEETP